MATTEKVNNLDLNILTQAQYDSIAEKDENALYLVTDAISMGRKEGTVIGVNSSATGNEVEASNIGAHAEGKKTTASGESSHAEGKSDNSAGDMLNESDSLSDIRNGWNTNPFSWAKGDGSHVEGINTLALSSGSHAEGGYNLVNGEFSHAEGSYNKVEKSSSHVEGYYTVADGAYMGIHVQGMANVVPEGNSDLIHIVGNGLVIPGVSESRSNAHTLDYSGNAWFSGDVYTGSTSGTNKDEGSKKLATEEYVDNNGGIFWVTYGETTNAEIYEAYQQGKDIKCVYGDLIYTLHTVPTGSNTIYFKALNSYFYYGGGICYYIYIKTSNSWYGAHSTGGLVDTPLQYYGNTNISSDVPHYRPIRVSTSEPTSSDGFTGDIWIVYEE